MAIPFEVDFTAPDSTDNMTAVQHAMTGDPSGKGSAIRLTWEAVPTAPENIRAIDLWLVDPFEQKRILTVTDPAITQYDYPFPRANVQSEFYLIQYIQSGQDILSGLWAQEMVTPVIDYLSIVSVVNPTTRRIITPAWASESEELTQEQSWHIPAGGTNYKEIGGTLRGRDMQASLQLFDRQDGSGITADQQWTTLKSIFDTRDTICFRDARANKLFGKILGNVRADFGKGGLRYTVPITLRRTSYTEGQ